MKQVVRNREAWVDGIGFFGGDRCACLLRISERLKKGEQTAVYTPNPVMLENAVRDKHFHAVLARAELNLPDGIGVVLAARMLGEDISERLSGVDMARRVLTLAAKRGYRVFLLGGKRGVAEEAARRLTARHSGLVICGVRDGYFSEVEERAVLAQIKRAKPDILLVCLGSPKQEMWIDRYRGALPEVRLFMALGGALDVFAGKVKRAPLSMQSLGLEWLWRMALEPRRFGELPKMLAFSLRTLKNCCHCAQSQQTKKSILKKI